MNLTSRSVVCAVAWLMAICTGRIADADITIGGNHVADIQYQQDGWTFIPIYDADGGSPRVTSIVAFADESLVIGENLAAVWFQRPAGDFGNWMTYSWSSQDKASIVKSLKDSVGIPDDDDWLWNVVSSEDIKAAQGSEVPQDYVKGVLAADPLAPVLDGMPSPGLLVELLAQAGYKAADVPIAKLDGASCNLGGALGAIALAVEASLESSDTLVAMSSFVGSGGAACVGGVGSATGAVFSSARTRPVGPATPWTRTGCTTQIENLGICETCNYTRSQNFIRRRTRAVGGVTVCEYQIQTCIESIDCHTCPKPYVPAATPTCASTFQLLPDIYPGEPGAHCIQNSNPWVAQPC